MVLAAAALGLDGLPITELDLYTVLPVLATFLPATPARSGALDSAPGPAGS